MRFLEKTVDAYTPDKMSGDPLDDGSISQGTPAWSSAYADPLSVQKTFLEAIHGHADGIIDFRAIREGQTRRIECSTIDETLKVIAAHDGWNCYVGVAKRRLSAQAFAKAEAEREPDPKKRHKAGGKHNLSQLSALFVDIDLDDDDSLGHKHEMDIRFEQMPIDPCWAMWPGGRRSNPSGVSSPAHTRRSPAPPCPTCSPVCLRKIVPRRLTR